MIAVTQVARVIAHMNESDSFEWVMAHMNKVTAHIQIIHNCHASSGGSHNFVGNFYKSAQRARWAGCRCESCHDSTTIRCNTLQHTTIRCESWHDPAATCCNTLQHAATHYSTLRVRTRSNCITLQHIASNCNTLQHTTTHCNTLTIVYKIVSVLHFGKTSAQQARWAGCRCGSCHDYSATHCNTIQRTATHYNTLQRTATRCNTLQHTTTRCESGQDPTTSRCNTLL